MKQSLRILAAAVVLAVPSAACLAAAQESSVAQRGDPARWYQPVTTAKQKYQNAMYEARRALTEALAECRKGADRKDCVTEARANYRHDVAYAKSFLDNRKPSA